jgi:hypothetical protein
MLLHMKKLKSVKLYGKIFINGGYVMIWKETAEACFIHIMGFASRD